MSRIDVPTLKCDRCGWSTQDLSEMGRFFTLTHGHMSGEDTKQARVAYLRLLTDEFNRIWKYGAIRSSEYSEREAFSKAKAKIEAVTKKIEEDIL